MKLLIVNLLILLLTAIPEDERVVDPPGMGQEVLYSGFLHGSKQGRTLHFVYAQARNDHEKAPLVVWLNGGPGCSSLLGMLQELGPYLIGNDYKPGYNLTKNEYSWNNVANLLFLQSPAIVGYSGDKDPKYKYTDEETANDALFALKNFIARSPQFAMRNLYISGQSYAGKYIPDLARKIIINNMDHEQTYINLKGILVGNGVMNFEDNSLDKSQIEYMAGHDFLDHRLWEIYQQACMKDFSSPRCKYFRMELQYIDEDRLNPYYVYEVCKNVESSEAARLKEAMKMSEKYFKVTSNSNEEDTIKLSEIKECPNDNGAIKYWNDPTVRQKFHVDIVNKTWSPCAELTYEITQRGSMEEYRQLFLNKAIKIWMYNGDWDDVVPYRDTEKNLKLLKREKIGEWEPWYYGDEKFHAGFYQLYNHFGNNTITVLTVKGAGHMVPQTQPRYAYQMFQNFIKDRPLNMGVDKQMMGQ